MTDALRFLLLPFAAAVAFVLIHAYFGVHVLKRRIVFADLALAQLSALGATVAFANGYATTSLPGFAYALLFTALGAALLTLTRSISRHVSQEAFVGILYVVATAATVLVVDRSPQGAEHVKRILVGNLLMVSAGDVARFGVLYLGIGVLHWFFRRPLLALSEQPQDAGRKPAAVWLWDFVFYLSFAVVVTSSVTTAGVLLVFSFLIVPAVVGSLFASRLPGVLAIAWTAGIVASAAGLAGSYALDLPSGAAIVTALGLVLVLCGLARILWFVDPASRGARWRVARRTAIGSMLALLLGSGLWLVAYPTGDQPLVALFERAVGLGAADFLNSADREIYQASERDVVRFQGEVERLNAVEKQARYAATPLPDDEIRRIASYQQSFNEMVRGERFVQDVLRGKARSRERWMVGLPAIMVALLGVVIFVRAWRMTREDRSTQQPEFAESPIDEEAANHSAPVGRA